MEEATDYAEENVKYQDGKYNAKFPWKSESPELRSNFKMVQNMTGSILRRLSKDPALFQFGGKLIQDHIHQVDLSKKLLVLK